MGIKDTEIYSENTGKIYPNYEALVEAEGHGWVVVLISDRPGTVPWVVGLYPTQAEATKAQARCRKRAQKEESMEGDYKVRSSVRVLWKEKP